MPHASHTPETVVEKESIVERTVQIAFAPQMMPIGTRKLRITL